MRKTLIALAAAVLFLTGCSVSVGNKSETKSSASPLPGQADGGITLSGEGFSLTVPKGWEDIQEQLGAQFAAAARESGETDGFADNVNVIRAGKSGSSLADLKKSIKGQLEQAGGKNIKVLDDTTLDGVDVANAQAEIQVQNNADGLIAHTNQYYVITDNADMSSRSPRRPGSMMPKPMQTPP